ncbi:GTP-binding protein [Mycena pura]|uniref:GTP-binding protein n=1 Tax=Mycena pura TaxID=153505 RepID=A0AAD6XVU2_9AGAR|nr:GTP-binding protein [Mycena pura]
MDKAIDLRSRCRHFRVLVIGRANAGKTTLLKKVCNSIEDPEIFSPTGQKIDVAIVEGSAERGRHDIENQLVFKSNPQFIFHDLCGFESGSGDETEKVKAFIAKRAGSNTLSGQLHAIWYCLPADTNRPLLETEKNFFNTDITGNVPVIAIFTKFDGLITKAFSLLIDDGYIRREALTIRRGKAQEMLTTNFIEPLMSTQFAPSDHVRLDDMRKETSDCNELIEKTANALTDDTLRLLFVSVQQNNINLCIRYAMERWEYYSDPEACSSANNSGLKSKSIGMCRKCLGIHVMTLCQRSSGSL